MVQSAMAQFAGSVPMQGADKFLVGAQQIRTQKYTRLVQGSPFYLDEYAPATIGVKNGDQYAGVSVKLNLADQELYFLTAEGKELVLTQPVDFVELNNATGSQKLQFDFFVKQDDAEKPWGWLQLLASGSSVKLYKRHVKVLDETTPYGSATVEQKIHANFHYYAWKNGEWTRLKKIEDVAEMEGVKKAEILDLIKKNKLKTKEDADWAQLGSLL